MQSIQQKNRKLAFILMIMACCMFGFGYALVPLYNVICKQLGINARTVSQNTAPMANTGIASDRLVTLQFTTTNNATLPWDFKANTASLNIHPGQNYHVTFYVKNNTDHVMTVQAIPSISPGIAGKYLKKTECFCFRKQTLQAGQALNMPVIFHLDPEFPDNIQDVTLSYTLFEVKTS